MFANEVIVECGNAKKSNAERMNELAAAYRAGDLEKYVELHELASAKAMQIARSKGLPVRYAEEIANEASFRLYDNIEKVKHVSSWLTRVVTNMVTDTRRKKSFSCEVVESDLAVNDDDTMDSETRLAKANRNREEEDTRPEVNPEAAAFLVAERESLRSTLTTLPTQQRKVLFLRFLKEKSEKEIAEILGISRSTVAAHCRVGKMNLRKAVISSVDGLSFFGIEDSYELAA